MEGYIFLSLLFPFFFLTVWYLSKKLNKTISLEELESKKTELIIKEEKIENLEKELRYCKEEGEKNKELLNRYSQNLAYKTAETNSLKEQLISVKEEKENIREKLKLDFKHIANQVLLDSSLQLNQKTGETLATILQPLGEKLERFEKKIDLNREKQLHETVSLKTQISKLESLNFNLAKEAANLSAALKGNSKIRGDWGEYLLEQVFENSGLMREIHFSKQVSMESETGQRLQPDFIVHLPASRSIIVDSKLSLLAYERYMSTEEDAERLKYLSEHIQSIKNHISSLSKKNYQSLYNIQSPDFVLMFIPIEPSFSLALKENSDLYQFALEKNVVIVTVSTLLATLRIISNIWKQENQSKNVLEIAKQGGLLYDKFVNFVEDLQRIGTSLEQGQKAYDSALKRLSEGQGNLIRSAEKIKDLGAKASKNLPDSLMKD